MKSKLFILLMVVSFNLSAQFKENKLVLTRTIAQLAYQENQQTITISDSGNVDLKYPRYHKLFARKNSFNNNFSKKSAQDVFTKLDLNLSTSSIENSLQSMKSKAENKLHYNSEPDLLELSFVENNKVIWKVEISDFLALEHYNKVSGEFDELVDLINNIQNVSTQYILQEIKGDRK